MLAEFGEQFEEARDFLEIVGWKIRVACASFVICAALNFTCSPSLRWKAPEGSERPECSAIRPIVKLTNG